jgi:hypothetical protein
MPYGKKVPRQGNGGQVSLAGNFSSPTIAIRNALQSQEAMEIRCKERRHMTSALPTWETPILPLLHISPIPKTVNIRETFNVESSGRLDNRQRMDKICCKSNGPFQPLVDRHAFDEGSPGGERNRSLDLLRSRCAGL